MLFTQTTEIRYKFFFDFLVFLGFSYRLRHKYFGGLIYLGSFSRFENWALIEYDVFGGIR